MDHCARLRARGWNCLAGLVLLAGVAGCADGNAALDGLPPADATGLASADAAWSPSEDVPSEFSDAGASYGI